MAGGDESQEARLAVATNDIEWIKESQRSANRGIDQLQSTLTQYMREQNDRSEKFATKEELASVRQDVDVLKGKWKWLAGLGSAGVVALGILEAILRGKVG